MLVAFVTLSTDNLAVPTAARCYDFGAYHMGH